MIESQSRAQRDLTSATVDPAQCILNLDSLSFAQVGAPFTVTLRAVDPDGVAQTAGGEIFFIRVENEWEKTTRFTCDPVARRPVVLSSEIFEQMVDHSNGTYSYTFSTIDVGFTTISIFWYDSVNHGIFSEFFLTDR